MSKIECMENVLKRADGPTRYRMTLTGTVQGVGFRPFVVRACKDLQA